MIKIFFSFRANRAPIPHLVIVCSTLINFLSFAQLSLIREKMSALTLSLPFSKTECAPDHHSFIKSALFSQSFFSKFPIILWVLNVGIEICHLRHKIFIQRKVICCTVTFFKDLKVQPMFLSSSKQKWTKCLELFNGHFPFALLYFTDLDFGVPKYALLKLSYL